MSCIIAIANEKGGVAKTTTTLSLGAALAEAGSSVLAIDLDAQANLTMALALQSENGHRTSASMLLEDKPGQNLVLKTAVPGLDLIPASSSLGLAERFLPIRSGYEVILRNALQPISSRYDFILMDCPPFLGAITTNALTAANLLIMPTQAEFFSIHALRNMMTLIRKVRLNGNPNLTYRLLLTLFDRRNRIHRTLSEQLRTTFGNGVLDTVIEVDTRLRESAIAGVPVLIHAPKTRSAFQYRALAQEIKAYVQETISQPA
ncbi:MAG TPA: ParA family protein [Anaerolinea thermolimosa]|uniref:ParA family protein n=1 Tax=Anaerolinea thermolimosa TaxID=229919 RepID=A0A3D1JH18_9CHLR|nr:ParA family protein [Anaerolinea thermolimosa]GAP06285.1 ATPase related with chromosome partitioning [Anaerolinea thermolimosa]HCE17871.1 ParA family protein [Anaerolinea thermolimosa]